jgi:Co/Zn/Cd efflux system component
LGDTQLVNFTVLMKGGRSPLDDLGDDECSESEHASHCQGNENKVAAAPIEHDKVWPLYGQKQRQPRAVVMNMSASCCNQTTHDPHSGDQGYRRVLWAVLTINAAMFAVEVAAGLAAGSASLQADALDFLGDTGNYAISLFVAGMALRYRAIAAFLKGATMGLFGLWVLGVAAWHVWHGTLPHAFTMGAVGVAALIANAASFGLLWAYRGGDSNMRSAWICTRNDVLGNLAVLFAALGVFGTGTGWPDVLVAVIMASLALQGAWVVLTQSRAELHIATSPTHA